MQGYINTLNVFKFSLGRLSIYQKGHKDERQITLTYPRIGWLE